MMQPYFLPYMGYLQLMSCADIFVLFDSAQYMARGWVNRNRILHPDDEKKWQYITMPIKNKSNFARINGLDIDHKDVMEALTAKLGFLKKSAPFYKDTMYLIDEMRERIQTVKNLAQVNTLLLEKLSEWLGIECEIILESSLDYDRDKVTHAGQWSLEVAGFLGAKDYINPGAGRALFSSEEFRERQIDLHFLSSLQIAYAQGKRRFVPNLSIIDVLLWNGRAASSEMVKSVELEKAIR